MVLGPSVEMQYLGSYVRVGASPGHYGTHNQTITFEILQFQLTNQDCLLTKLVFIALRVYSSTVIECVYDMHAHIKINVHRPSKMNMFECAYVAIQCPI